MAGDVDIQNLKEELQEEIEKNKALKLLITEEEELVCKLTKELEALEQGSPDSMWYMKYKAQHDENVKLEQSIKMLEEKLVELQGHFREVEGQEVPLSSHDHMSENNLKQYVKKLERRKAELQGELKDCEWRLNQESIALQKTLKERDAASTELSEVLASTTDSKAKKKTKSSGSSPVAAVKSKSKTKF